MKGDKIRSGYANPPFSHLTHAVSGAQNKAELLRTPCILGGPQRRGTKSEVARPPFPEPGFPRAQKRAELLRNPCSLRGPQQWEA